MKKLFSTVIFFLLFLSGPLMSQKQLYFGLAGTGLSSVITNQNNYGLVAMDYKVPFGGSGNLNIGFDFNNHVGLKLEIGYTKLGQKYTDNVTNVIKDSAFSRNIKLNYLQVPLLFKYRSGGNTKLYLMVGPQFNILLSANQDYTLNGALYDTTKTNLANQKFVVGQSSIKERFSTLDIMARIDFGVDIALAKNLYLNAGLTLAYGLLDINASDWRIKDHTGTYHASHNGYGGINVGISYALPLSK